MNELYLQLQPYILGILTIILGFLGTKLRTFLDEKIDKERQDKIRDIVKGVVDFVEQVAKVDIELKGKEKFELAKERALLILNEKGYIISEQELQMLIESFVLSLGR